MPGTRRRAGNPPGRRASKYAAAWLVLSVYAATTLAGCMGGPTTVILSADTHALGEEPLVLSVTPPLHRTKRSLDIHLQLAEAWKPISPYDRIELANGETARLKVVLIGEDGSRYHPFLIGASGNSIGIRFKDWVPKDVAIVEVSLSASRPLTVNSVVWQDWNPL